MLLGTIGSKHDHLQATRHRGSPQANQQCLRRDPATTLPLPGSALSQSDDDDHLRATYRCPPARCAALALPRTDLRLGIEMRPRCCAAAAGAACIHRLGKGGAIRATPTASSSATVHRSDQRPIEQVLNEQTASDIESCHIQLGTVGFNEFPPVPPCRSSGS